VSLALNWFGGGTVVKHLNLMFCTLMVNDELVYLLVYLFSRPLMQFWVCRIVLCCEVCCHYDKLRGILCYSIIAQFGTAYGISAHKKLSSLTTCG
jgi:hypothetical protein